MLAIRNQDDVKTLLSAIKTAKKQLPTLTNETVAGLFSQTKPLEKAIKDLNDTVRLELIERREEGGMDSKGNRYIAADDKTGVKLTQRVTVKLKPDAAKIAERLRIDGLFPRKIEPELMASKLRELEVEEELYTSPDITMKTISALLDAEEITSEDVWDLLDEEESVSWAVTVANFKRLEEDNDV